MFLRARRKEGAALFVITSVIGFLAEVLGTSTGFPFGKYYYTDFLGPKVFGVPEVVPLIWFVIAYLTFSIARNAFRQQELFEKMISCGSRCLPPLGRLPGIF